jgi:hypothetical protein
MKKARNDFETLFLAIVKGSELATLRVIQFGAGDASWRA